jgi:hypothetical protein
MTHFLVYWRRWGLGGMAFAADVMADSAQAARERFGQMFPADQVVGVKRAKGWDGSTGEGGRWLA